jgi:hypothetical protein
MATLIARQLTAGATAQFPMKGMEMQLWSSYPPVLSGLGER